MSKSGFFNHAAFYGGTALRILYGLDRFSEDLDFTLLRPSPLFDIRPFLEAVQKEFAIFGLETIVEQKMKTAQTDILSAFLKTNTVQYNLAIGNADKVSNIQHNESIKIKLEVDINPPAHHFTVKQERLQVPYSFPISTITLSELFAGKMHAALYRKWQTRVKGRDWYDVIWYVNKGIPLNTKFFSACVRQSNTFGYDVFDRNVLVQQAKERINKINWMLALEDVGPFIGRNQMHLLKQWSSSFFSDLIEKIQIE